jgi:transketolase
VKYRVTLFRSDAYSQEGLMLTTPSFMNAYDISAARGRCRRYRRRILDISQQVTALHIAPAFSCLEITDVIYHGMMRQYVDGSYRDVFIMSKGHGCMIQYVILEDKDILSSKDLDLYCKPGGRLCAHPDCETPGIVASTGSLGHGLGMAAGQAYAENLKGADTRIYCVLSDGEFQEGSTWEAMLMAANLRLDNLIAFMDYNDFNSLERISERQRAFYPLVPKAEAFGWESVEVDGHDEEAILQAVLGRYGGRPLLVVCRTVKGKGVSYMENVPIWHYRSPSKEEYHQGIKELSEGAA